MAVVRSDHSKLLAAEVTGAHYQLVDSPALPKPVQSPRPPIVLGGAAKKRGAALAARFADEFNIGFAAPAATAERIANVEDATLGALQGIGTILG